MTPPTPTIEEILLETILANMTLEEAEQALTLLITKARIDEVQHMPHERRPEQHEFEDGKYNGANEPTEKDS